MSRTCQFLYHVLEALLFQAGDRVPAVVAATGPDVANRFIEFFVVAIRNLNTRRAYAGAVRQFCSWLEHHDAPDLRVVEPIHVATYIEQLGRSHTKPSVARLSVYRIVCPKPTFGSLLGAAGLSRAAG